MSYNNLTSAEAERLAMLAEEAGEVVHEVSCILLGEKLPFHDETQEVVRLEAECADLLAITVMMENDNLECPDPTGSSVIDLIDEMETREVLMLLAASAGRIVQAVGKTLRHGYDSYHPQDPSEDNRILLAYQIRDFLSIVEHLSDDYFPGLAAPVDEIIAKKMRYTHHQEQIELVAEH